MKKFLALTVLIAATFLAVYPAKIELYNYTTNTIKIHVKVKGAAKDEDSTIKPLLRYKLDRIIGKVSGLNIDGKEYDVSDGKSYSYDTDEKGKYLLLPNPYGYLKPFSFLGISDVHAVATPNTIDKWVTDSAKFFNDDIKNKQNTQKSIDKEIATLQQKEGNEKKINELNREKSYLKNQINEIMQKRDSLKLKPAQDINKVQTIVNFIEAKGKNLVLRALIIPGDLVYWNYSKNIEFNAFKEIFFNPLSAALEKIGGRVFANAGNHDQYGGHDTPIMKWIEDKYGFFYTFNIHGVHFIVLGMTIAPAQFSSFVGKIASEAIDKDAGSLEFLEADLKHVPSNVPVIIMLHFPIGAQADMKKDIREHVGYAFPLRAKNESWATQETDKIYKNSMDRFYAALENHNILAIICGHAHRLLDHNTPNGKYRAIIIPESPVLFKFDPAQVRTLSVSAMARN